MTKKKSKRTASKLTQDDRDALDRQRRMVCLQMAGSIEGATESAAKLVGAAGVINDFVVNGKRPPADIKDIKAADPAKPQLAPVAQAAPDKPL